MQNLINEWYLSWLEFRLWWLEFSISIAEARQRHIEVSLREMDKEHRELRHHIQGFKGSYE